MKLDGIKSITDEMETKKESIKTAEQIGQELSAFIQDTFTTYYNTYSRDYTYKEDDDEVVRD